MSFAQAFTSFENPNIHDMKLMLCIWCDHHGVIHYMLFEPNGDPAIGLNSCIRDAHQSKNGLNTKFRHDKVIL